MRTKLTEKEFWNALGDPKIRDNFKEMSIEDVYTACYNVIERAAELYSELYNIEKEELIGEANLSFVSMFDSVHGRYYATTGHYIQDLKRRLNASLYNYCEYEMGERSVYAVCHYNSDIKGSGLTTKMSGDIVNNALDNIEKRERMIIKRYYYDGFTFDEIGEELKITGQRARQILNVALRKLRHSKVTRNLEYLLEQYC